jgi:hypothetical protein
MDYYLLAGRPFPGRVMPMMRIGRHLTGARCADVVTAADAVPIAAAQWRDRRSSGGHLAAVMPDRTAVPSGCDGDDRRLKRQAAAGGELT